MEVTVAARWKLLDKPYTKRVTPVREIELRYNQETRIANV